MDDAGSAKVLDDAARAVLRQHGLDRVEPLSIQSQWERSWLEQSGFAASGFPGQVTPAEGGTMVLTLDVLSVLIPDEEAFNRVAALQEDLEPLGWQALVTAHQGHSDFCYLFNMGVNAAVERFEHQSLLACFRAADAAPLLWVRGTNGANYHVSTGDILRRIAAWRERCSLRVLGAGFDWLRIGFTTLPAHLEAFAAEVYDFCPDTLDQGIVKPMPADIAAASEEEQLAWLGEALDDQEPADLAEYLRRERDLFLWWD